MWSRVCAKPPPGPPEVASGADVHPPRLHGTDGEVKRIAAGLLSHTLPRPEWTHETHLAAVSVLLLQYPEIDLKQQLPGIISSCNAAVGGVNDNRHGYHHTVTRFWIAAAKAFHADKPAGSFVERVNRFIASPAGRRDAALRHFSPARLFSVEARRRLVEPDLMPFPWDTTLHDAPAPKL